MSGLGLSQAVDAYVSGRQSQEKLRQMDAQRAEEAALAQADQAYGAVHQKAQEAALAMNPTAEYKPNDEIQFEAAEARGRALAKAGLWKHYLQNEGLVAQQRLRVRGEALNQYKVDGDPEALVRKVYPTIFDGRKVVGTKRIQGADGIGNLKAVPDSIEIEFSDGKKATKPVAELVSELNKTMMDPAKYAEAEIKTNFAEQLIESRGEQSQKTEGVKAEGRKGAEETKGKYRLDTEGVKLEGKRVEAESREKVASTRAGATLGAAQTRAGATLGAAETRAGASRDVANTKASAPGGGAKKPDPVVDAKRKVDLMAASGLTDVKDPVTGRGLSGELASRASQRVDQHVAAGKTLQEAIATTRDEMKKAGKLQ